MWEGFRLLGETRNGQPLVYVYEGAGSYTPLARIYGTGDKQRVDYYRCSHNGMPQALTDEDGKLHWRQDVETWGETRSEYADEEGNRWRKKWDGAPEENLRFAGQYLDRETGLHYNTFRYYAPDMGRFITPDPIGLKGGLNLYAYAPNPLSWIDPLGLLAGCWKKKLRKIDDAVRTPGNSGLKMTLSRREANHLGKEFVGEGYSVVRGKKGELWYISANGKRMYRSPTPKSSDYAKTGKQANFHERKNVNDNWWDSQRVSNVHVHVE